MQVDRAGWHVVKTLVVPENIWLVLQPAYSPELNAVAHLWEDLREKQLPNQAQLDFCEKCQSWRVLRQSAFLLKVRSRALVRSRPLSPPCAAVIGKT